MAKNWKDPELYFVFIAISGIQITLLCKMISMEAPPTGLFVAITVISVLLLLGVRIHDIEKITAGAEGIEANLRTLGGKVSVVEAEMKAERGRIDKAFLLSMGDSMYKNLHMLASGHYGSYKKQPGGGFDDELHHLRNIGYITVKNNSISDIPVEGEDLSLYIQATETGKEFIRLHESITDAPQSEPHVEATS